MTKKPKLLPCVCGGTPHNHKYPGVTQKWVGCASCVIEVIALTPGHAAIMWNASMKALTEAKNADVD